MNSDSSELETSSNSRSLFMPMPQASQSIGTSSREARGAAIKQTQLLKSPPIGHGRVCSSPYVSSTTGQTASTKYHHHNSGSNNGRKLMKTDVDNDYNLNNELMKAATLSVNSKAPSVPQRMSIGAKSNQHRQQQQQQQQDRYVWEMRKRSPNTPARCNELSSDNMQFLLQTQQRPQHYRLARSPPEQYEQHLKPSKNLQSPSSPHDMDKSEGHHLRDGEIVVFDDIDTNWMNKSNNAAYNYKHTPRSTNGSGSGPRRFQSNNEDILKVTKMIGQLPIAEYEGSPRRFGNPAKPKRGPGLPQRVSPKPIGISTEITSQNEPHEEQEEEEAEANDIRQKHQSQAQHFFNSTTSSYTLGGANNSDNKSLNLIDINDDSCDSNGQSTTTGKIKTPTFDYLYEFSETRKVLEEFFKPKLSEDNKFAEFCESKEDLGTYEYELERHEEDERERKREIEAEKHVEQAYIGQRLARIPQEELYMVHRSPSKQPYENPLYVEPTDIGLFIDSNSRSSGDLADTELEANLQHYSRNFTLSPETTDYDSNCGDLDSLSNDLQCSTEYGGGNLYSTVPPREDGLSSGHASEIDANGLNSEKKHAKTEYPNADFEDEFQSEHQPLEDSLFDQNEYNASLKHDFESNYLHSKAVDNAKCAGESVSELIVIGAANDESLSQQKQQQQYAECESIINTTEVSGSCYNNKLTSSSSASVPTETPNYCNNDSSYEAVYAAAAIMNNKQVTTTPPPLAPATTSLVLPPPAVGQRQSRVKQQQQQQQKYCKQQSVRRESSADIEEAMKEIRSALQRAKKQPDKLKFCDEVLPADPDSPVWVPRKSLNNNGKVNNTSQTPTNSYIHKSASLGSSGSGSTGPSAVPAGSGPEEEEADTDLETDRLLGQQRLDDQGFFDDKTLWPKSSRIGPGSSNDTSDDRSPTTTINHQSPRDNSIGMLSTNPAGISSKPQTFSSATIRQGIGTALTPCSPDRCQIVGNADVAMTSPEKLQYSKSPTGSIKSIKDSVNSDKKAKSRHKEGLLDPAVLIEGVLFRARYLGSTQLVCEGQPTKTTRMMQAEEAVSRIKAPEGESQPSTEVDLFISTEKIMVLNTDLKEIMMDHALRTISYIADIGDLVVLMARRRFVPADSNGSDAEGNNNIKDNKENSGGSTGSGKPNRTPKMICHVFESDEAQFIAQSIGQAFQVAYMEFLKANGIEDNSFVKEMDYQEVLNSQEIFGDELEIFAKKERQKEVVVPKSKGEILGVVIVESGWGSMLPTVVIANLMSGGAAARCGQLNIGDQLIAINGLSLVGLPLSMCQNYIRNAKNQTAVKFTVVPCPPVVEVKIKRPNTKYQLGFSVQNGVICSLLRGGIAERGGVRVGHRIIEINNQSVVAVPHEKIVNLLATSVGEILMKTMPTSMFRLLTGQENPIYI